MNETSRTLETALFVLILLAAAALRLPALGQAPAAAPLPIEAEHLDEPLGVLEGDFRLVYDEGQRQHGPVWAYTAALVMLVAGRSLAAARLTSALFGLALVVLVYVWVRIATQNQLLALATMAGLAVSFWGVMTSRLATSLVTFPVFYMLAAIFLRRGIRVEEDVEDDFLPLRVRPRADVEGWLWFVLAGLALGLSFYTYPVAYVMWLVFPAFFAFLSLTQPGAIRQAWRGLALMLAVGALVAAPIAVAQGQIYGGQVLGELAQTAASLREASRSVAGIIGVWGERVEQPRAAGTPLLGPVLSLLYYVGASVAVLSLFFPYRPARRHRRTYQDTFRITSANMFMLLTLAAGLAPVLITGLMPRSLPIVGMQPALYYFPALAVLWLAESARQHIGRGAITALTVAYAATLLGVLALTVHSTFTLHATGLFGG